MEMMLFDPNVFVLSVSFVLNVKPCPVSVEGSTGVVVLQLQIPTIISELAPGVYVPTVEYDETLFVEIMPVRYAMLSATTSLYCSRTGAPHGAGVRLNLFWLVAHALAADPAFARTRTE